MKLRDIVLTMPAPSSYQAAKVRALAALSDLSGLVRALPEDGKETRAEAEVAGLIAHYLDQALTAAGTALNLARDEDWMVRETPGVAQS